MKFKNRKALAGIVVSAAVLSIGTVGFSGWIVFGSHEVNKEVESLGVNVATMTNYAMEISDPVWSGQFAPSARDVTQEHDINQVTMLDGGDAQICFGPKQGDQEGAIRAQGNNKDDLEHLTLEFTFDVTCADFDNHFDKLTVAFVFGAASSGKQTWGTTLNAAAAGNYITNPFPTDFAAVTLLTGKPTVNSGLEDVSGYTGLIKQQCVSITGDVATFKVRLAWGWGTKFSSNNPSVDARQDNATNLQSLLDDIEALNDILADGSGTVTVKVTAVGK